MSVAWRASLAVSSLIRLSQTLTCFINYVVFHLVFHHLFHHLFHRCLPASGILQTSGGISQPAQRACAALFKSPIRSHLVKRYSALTEEYCQRILPDSTQQTLFHKLSVHTITTDCTWICRVMIKSWRMARVRNP